MTKEEAICNEKIEAMSTLLDCMDHTYKTLTPPKKIHLPPRTQLSDYQIINLLSKGGFGEVYLVKKGTTPYALKRVLKETIRRQPQTALFMEERDLLIKARNTKFLVFAHCTFQDENSIYFLMDFFPGGDFINLLANNPLTEEQIKFYAAEILLSIQELHSLNFIHRDLKPENLLITKEGHLRLCDFGSCAHLSNETVVCDVTVGTPDYVSPEVLFSTEKRSQYGKEVDLWTFGALLYEMINDEPPFYSEMLEETYERIKNIDFTHKKGSNEIKDLISKLLVQKESRLSLEEVMKHPFFSGIDFFNIHNCIPPIIPNINSVYDVSYFPDATISNLESNYKMEYKGFIGFTYDPLFYESLLKYNTILNDTTILKEDIKDSTILNNTTILKDSTLLNNTTKLNEDINNTTINIKDGNTDNIINDKNEVLFCIKDSFCKFHKRKADLCFDLDCGKNITCSFHKRTVEQCLKRKTLSDPILCQKIKKLSINDSGIIKLKNNMRELNLLLEKMYSYKNENSIKKELKIKKIQIKEYQQRLEEQIKRNIVLEEEIILLKKENSKLRRKKKESSKIKNKVLVCKTNKKIENRLEKMEEMDLIIENEKVFFNNNIYNINNVIVNLLGNNELTQLKNKERNLILIFMFVEVKIKEKRNLRAVEESLKKEYKIKEGLEKMLKVMKGKSLEETEEQLSGTLKRIDYLNKCLEEGRRLTDASFEEYKESIDKYEFNNHTFIPTTFNNALCDHCNDLLRGTSLQGLQCEDCSFIVHRKCFVLVKESCEMRQAINNGEKWFVRFACKEDMERIMKIFKV